jgi:hypothetical protein
MEAALRHASIVSDGLLEDSFVGVRESLLRYFGLFDISPATKSKMARECRQFYSSNRQILPKHWDAYEAGGMFWASRNSYTGAGQEFSCQTQVDYKTREWLQHNAESYGPECLYIDNNNLISSERRGSPWR